MRRLGDAAALALRIPIVEQFLKFGAVGVTNTLLTFAVFTILVKELGVWYVAASAIGFIAGAANGFLLNRSWTFRGHRGGQSAALRWTVVQGVGLLCDLGLIYVFVDSAGLPKLVGQALAIALVVGGTFYVNRIWTFRMHLAAEGAPERRGAAIG